MSKMSNFIVFFFHFFAMPIPFRFQGSFPATNKHDHDNNNDDNHEKPPSVSP
jgi:hypothetical protein